MLDSTFENVSTKLCQFIAQSYLDDEEQILPNTPIIKLNILDSASIFDVVEFIHREFSVRLPVLEIHPDNFNSVQVLSELVYRQFSKEVEQ
ncbi:hypothetical protein [Pseudoalteromonas tunicata]|jgi:acyl carrier protein|uniref:Acyl carrier protein n=1 Tax=Pseudoalteromonas tunicata D2 TaxID=87626 RepID=A4C5W4_9GAMM|nr:hypothetical protein [Pseudoalteromonas tunicata]ATC95342.1 hypothetical protein PTUN_a2943 [Pseudoalteromonas tunicata]AXT30933.1 acyl carrier protein [Pseudoalteromonas tunicata]EAR29368.1 Acyl carrier protein [Pseudoalteromonas tunicata D2]MDP4982047.1 acyl carrier protein [Pseudoalteromonas tunicata]MDP5213080.1 acyl carrier protein [Pseudoalteromonas tunicata]